MEPARGESCTLDQRRRPSAFRGQVLSLHEKSLQTWTTPTTRGRKRGSPVSIPPCTVWEPQPHWLVAEWLTLTEPARGESCTPDRRRRPPHSGWIRFYPRKSTPSIHVQLHQPGDENRDCLGRYRPARCGNLNPTVWLLIGWGSWSQRVARVAPLTNVDHPPHSGIRFYPWMKSLSIRAQLHQPGVENRDRPG